MTRQPGMKFDRRNILQLGVLGGGTILSRACAMPRPTSASDLSQTATDLVPAHAALVRGELYIGDFLLREASAGTPYAVQYSRSRWPYLRVEARSGDNAPWDRGPTTFVDRAEVVANATNERIPYGQEFSQSFAMYLDPATERGGEWCVLWQHHHSAEHPTVKAGVNPPFSFVWETEGLPGLAILARTSSTEGLTRGHIAPTTVYHDPAYQPGKWVHWRLVARYNWQGDAFLHIWRDEALVASLEGPSFRLGYEWDSSPNFGVYGQFGVYRASASRASKWRNAHSSPMIVHYADFTMKRV